MASERAIVIPIEELAYMAGYFDGEGCITFMKMARGRAGYFRIGLVSRDFASLLSFARYFGGKIRTHRQRHKGEFRHYWAWYRNSTDAQNVLRVLIPLLRGKRQKAEAALAMTFSMNGKPITDKEFTLRQNFKNLSAVA